MRYFVIIILVLGLGALRAGTPPPSAIRFENIASKAGVNFITRNSPTPNKNQIETMVAGVGLLDYDGDGWLDIYLVNGAAIPSLQKESPAYWNRLYRNNHDGTFTDVSKETGISSRMGKGMSVSFADYDGDGFLDAFVANDTTPGFLFHNLGGKKFEEVGTQAGVAYAPNGVALSGMGSDFRDVNNDGRPDIWYTAVERETFPLLMNQGNGEFDDVTQSSGLQATKDMSGWGNGIFDFDNDGWKDLLVVRANVLDNISELGPSRKYPEPNSLFRNLGNGKFADVGPSAGPDFVEQAPHRGVAFGDLFNDGRIDAVVSVLGGPVEILRNVSETGNHWLLLKLVGTKSNRMGLGAQIHITTADGASQWNEATTAVGYTASSDSRVHFGLGRNRVIKDVEIRWPSGLKQVLHDVAADQILTVEEPQR